MKRQAAMHFALALTIDALLASCSQGSEGQDSEVTTTITVQAAISKTDQYAEMARQALSPEARLISPFKQDGITCTNPANSEGKGRVMVSHNYEVAGLPPGDPAQHYAKIRDWWAKNSFRVTQDSQSTGYVLAENSSDGFTMMLRVNQGGQAYLGVSSPCVWPNGTPEPKN